MADCAVLILAAGKGTRMKSELPKVLHPLAEKPLLAHVLDAARGLNPSRIVVVVGHGGDQVRAAMAADDVSFVTQEPQLGTGHAVQCGLTALGEVSGELLILNGDVPLIRTETLTGLLDLHRRGGHPVTVLSCMQNPPTGYGRMVRGELGNLERIVEEKDADTETRAINEINSGTYCVDAARLPGWLSQLSTDNAQGEYYLTDIVPMANSEHREGSGSGLAGAFCHHDGMELSGINNRVQLAQLGAAFRNRLTERLMMDGVSFIDPGSCWIAADAKIGRDTQIAPGVIIGPNVTIAEGCVIGPYCEIRNADLGPGTVLHAYCHVDGAVAKGPGSIGPFARLRPGTVLEANIKVGDFVELKKTHLGEGSKVPHLAYVGDAEIGKNCNIGCGTITCNYDGVNKHKTTLGDGVFIGSDTQLVAPVTLGDGAYVGAGSTITKDVPGDALATSRVGQRVTEGWAAKRRATLKKNK
ncbi:bifunctional UDP-N-acetylglucosamine diphosphorylase/glucosamine-1-phosphate N-acetyltransferase GlmU [Magnetofaba australis]|uniref:Bifunctional protein GlmU n=1 Tax=Magnetofaba australis IT-1 TaxID=1434232 RepID=A0A1Y2JZS4_9PROT|nr:bifunctional UDP-N-acetylglucosamine diphosphorylase/glucosamine-1-phosphate N-acetyltransferase GlmU [Magnetofaba australis]OSM00034.1 putative glucosamine-1-phosphate N-acetyltransferase/UDP-N-acetylglucosamine pyrophosphorylase [Magnetofaba australis IT-1]